MHLPRNRIVNRLLKDNKLCLRWGEFEIAARQWAQWVDRDNERALFWYRRARSYLPALLTRDTAKIIKSLKVNALTGVVHLSPHNESGFRVCSNATPGCILACLGHSSGHMAIVTGGGIGNAMRARVLRTWAFLFHRDLFLYILCEEIGALAAHAKEKGYRPYVRPDGTSDLMWHTYGIMEQFPTVQFYDYTKNEEKMLAFLRGELPANYHLTFSRSEKNDDACRRILDQGGNVAMVFLKTLPKLVTWDWTRFTRWESSAPFGSTWNVVNGDETDARPDDRSGVVVGLTDKGPKAKADMSGFVIR